MARKFLSFLGTGRYVVCNYRFQGETVNNVRYVQEAMIDIYCKDFNSTDEIVIFLTDNAKKKNWDMHTIDNQEAEGLESRLDTLLSRREAENRPKVRSIHPLPEGASEDDIWQIFQSIVNIIEDGDQIVFDITHAFRSIPMLALIVLNYSRVMKDVGIEGIYYGAFETLGSVLDAQQIPIEKRTAEIFDLTPFINLMDWTSAIENFLSSGDTSKIQKLSDQGIRPIMKKYQRSSEQITNLRKFSHELNHLSQSIHSCRCPDIYNFDSRKIQNLVDACRNEQEPILKPLIPLLEKIPQKIESFSHQGQDNEIKTGLAAVKWCIDHNLIQQGFTILQESIVSSLVVKLFGKNEIYSLVKRNYISKSMIIVAGNIPEEEWDPGYDGNIEELKKAIHLIDKGFAIEYRDLSLLRNDINHGGCKADGFMEPKKLKKKLIHYYSYTLNI